MGSQSLDTFEVTMDEDTIIQNEWQDKELECFKDPMNCVIGYFCAWCMMCDSSKRLGKSVPLFCLFSYFCAPCALFSLRSETREKFGIEGSAGMDCACCCCCPLCVNCQVNKELKKREPDAEGLLP